MGIRLYDEALCEKIKKWVKDPSLRVLKPEESTRLFEMTFDETKDKPLTLPIVALSRAKTVEILNINKEPKTFSGFLVTTGEKKFINLNCVPIQLNYQIDIYTKGMEEADEYIRNFVFNFINYPALEITLPYNDLNITHKSNINLDASITDNTDIKEHLFPDQFVRFTLTLTVSDAYLFSMPVKDIPKIESIDLEVQDRTIIDKKTKQLEIVETHEIL